MTAKTKIVLIYAFTLVGIISWIAAIFCAPYFKSQSSPIAGFLYAVYSPTCHQIPSRCFYAFGYPTAVCARCLGIYLGFLLGTLIFPFVKGFSMPTMPKAKIFISLFLPIVTDTAANILGLWTSTDWVRFITGVLWGLILPFYFFAGLADFFLHKRKKLSP
ncbi:MAG: DUF2085 domain-containing protein [Candidatus Aminicenantes bacterium]|nr:MAG: DUF2085 domain-containing protein [Candidatus Aminicenantes bacterium]